MANNRKQVLDVKKVVITVIVGLALLTAIVAGILAATGIFKGKETPTQTVDVNDILQSGKSIKINMKDCVLYVGTQLKLTCTTKPESYASQVIWKSANENVATIDSEGNLTILAEGETAITATYGILSDTIAVAAVTKGAVVPDSDLPVYEVVDGETKEVTAPSETVPSETDTNGQPVETTTAETESSGNIQTDPAEETTGAHAVQIRDTLVKSVTNCGFTSYVDNTYVYNEDGNYLGQIIIEAGRTQIYVMTRTTEFDKNLKQLLETVLPTSYENVYASFVAATQDQTLSGDGLKIRIVAAKNNDHAQLILYY